MNTTHQKNRSFEQLLNKSHQKNRSSAELRGKANYSCPQAGQELQEVVLTYHSGNSLVEPRGAGNDPLQHESGRTKEHTYDEELFGKAHQKNQSFQ